MKKDRIKIIELTSNSLGPINLIVLISIILVWKRLLQFNEGFLINHNNNKQHSIFNLEKTAFEN